MVEEYSNRVYEVGPVFRAEPLAQPRHLAQYTSLDAELALLGEQGTADHQAVMTVLRDVIAVNGGSKSAEQAVMLRGIAGGDPAGRS